MPPGVRRDAGEHVELWSNTNDIGRALRFPVESYRILCDILREPLTRNQEMAEKRGGYITPETCVYLTLRWLSGSSYIDLMHVCGISRAALFQLLWMTIDAIRTSEDPRLNNIHFPQTPEELDEAAQGFEAISYQGAIPNCVSVIDGYHVKIKVPPSSVGAPRAYYSGHHNNYGVNVQAAVDSRCRFQFIGLGGPGVISDRDALRTSELEELILGIPSPYMSIGDGGYTAFESLATIYNAYYARWPVYDNFNFFASQLRIRVEMAFGLMTQKWAILQNPIKVSPFSVWRLMVAIARLHNFCINQRESAYVGGVDFGVAMSRLLPSQPLRPDGTPILLRDDYPFIPGESSRREFVAFDLQRRGLERPERLREINRRVAEMNRNEAG
jgi:DDE superfamily endonuclease